MLLFLSTTALADPLPGAVSDDAFDISQGAVVSDVVPTPALLYTADAVNVENSFQVDPATEVESGVGFWTDMGATEPAWVELTLPGPTCVAGVRLFAIHDGDTFNNRSMNHFTLVADPGGTDEVVVDENILVPYQDTPGNTAAADRQLDLVLTGPRTIATVFRIEITQHVEASSPYNGARVVEIDALPCDLDGDGVFYPEDCDDDEPLVPHGPEICDGLDNDCDGTVDLDAIDMQPYYLDADGDGYVNLNQGRLACAPGNGYIEETAADCDDGDLYIYPGADETVGDGVDSDCDGQDPPAPVEEEEQAKGCSCGQASGSWSPWRLFARR